MCSPMATLIKCDQPRGPCASRSPFYETVTGHVDHVLSFRWPLWKTVTSHVDHVLFDRLSGKRGQPRGPCSLPDDLFYEIVTQPRGPCAPWRYTVQYKFVTLCEKTCDTSALRLLLLVTCLMASFLLPALLSPCHTHTPDSMHSLHLCQHPRTCKPQLPSFLTSSCITFVMHTALTEA